MISFITTLEDFNTKLWRFHLPVTDDIAAQFIQGDNRRVSVHLEGIPVFPAALMKSKEYWFILINKPIREKLNIAEGKKITLTLEKDLSEYSHEMPEEMQVLLDQDEVGSGYFYGLTKGKQRGLVYIVTKVKNINSRLNKSLAILEHLKDVKGKLDYKMLNE